MRKKKKVKGKKKPKTKEIQGVWGDIIMKKRLGRRERKRMIERERMMEREKGERQYDNTTCRMEIGNKVSSKTRFGSRRQKGREMRERWRGGRDLWMV